MRSSVAEAFETRPDNPRVIARPAPAKSTLRDNGGSSALSEVVIDAAKKVYVKQGAAAEQLGKDEGNFSRDVKARRLTLAHLEDLGAPFLAELGTKLVDQYGDLATPQARAMKTLDQIEDGVKELRQLVQHFER